VRLTRELLLRLGVGEAGIGSWSMSDELEVQGSRLKLLASCRCSTRRMAASRS